MTTKIRNWAVEAAAMEAKGATNSQIYIRAKALAQGKLDPMPTSLPEAPYSISAVWNPLILASCPSTGRFLLLTIMTNYHLSMEQRFHLEAAFREIDDCEDINKLKKLKKQIITSQKNEKAVAREVMVQHRKEIEFSTSKKFGFG